MRISDWSSDVCSSDLDGAAHACAHRQDRRLRWADDCREFTHSIHTQIGNCCRSALIFVRLELPVACPIGKIPDFGSYRRKALAVCATHDRREQSAFDRNRNADIRAGEAEYPVLRPRRISCRKGHESLGICLNHKIRSEEHTSELQSLMRISYAD